MTRIPEADKTELAETLSRIPGIDLTVAELIGNNFKNRPSISAIDVLANAATRNALLNALRLLMTSM